MASMRRSLYSGASSAVRFCKSTMRSSSSSHGAPVASGSIAYSTPGPQTCGPKLNSSTIRSAMPSSKVSPTSTPFCSKSNISGSVPGSRFYASQMARLPRALGATLSLIPYYSAVADSQLVSRLGASGESAIFQGTLTHRNPDL